MSETLSWEEEILAFWFGLAPEQWWKKDPALDRAIVLRFHRLWCEERERPPESFLGSPRQALAAVILFDQLPRNMMRGEAEQFATDTLAMAIARSAIDIGLDDALAPEQRAFLYMPFQHSEGIEDQRRSLLLFTALGNPEMLRFAQLHHDVIARFGRFPHRNAVLGRHNRAEERDAAKAPAW